MCSQKARESQDAVAARQLSERAALLCQEIETWVARCAGDDPEAAWYFRRAAASLEQARGDLGLARNLLRARSAGTDTARETRPRMRG